MTHVYINNNGERARFIRHSGPYSIFWNLDKGAKIKRFALTARTIIHEGWRLL